MSANTAPIGPFAGINNRLPDHQLGLVERGQKAGDYLRNAVNVDLTNAGTLQRRKGVTLTLSGTQCHSLWADEQGGYFVDGDALKTFPGGVVLRSGLAPGRPISFARAINGDLYWSNGVTLERIRNGASIPAGVPLPRATPLCSASGGGSLDAGHYRIAITALAADGEESGATWPVQIQVPDNGQIVVSGLPGTRTNIYVSPPNGELLFLVASTTATGYTIPIIGAQGQTLQSQDMRPMPPGQIVRIHNARLLVADRFGLYYSEPYAFGWHNPLRGYIPLPGITLVEPMQSGVFVATADKTYWLAGADIADSSLLERLPYGAAEGTSTRIANSLDVAWFSQRGIVRGTSDGQIQTPQEENVVVNPARAGATLYREQSGMRQLIAGVSNTTTTRAAANSFMTMEVRRKENML